MKTILSVLVFTLFAALATPVFAAEGSTLRVVAVETDDVPAYVAALKEGKKLILAQDPKFTFLAFRATFAGPDTGGVVVSIRYPGGLPEFAKAWSATAGNVDIAAWLASLDGLRTIVSDSLYAELPLD